MTCKGRAVRINLSFQPEQLPCSKSVCRDGIVSQDTCVGEEGEEGAAGKEWLALAMALRWRLVCNSGTCVPV